MQFSEFYYCEFYYHKLVKRSKITCPSWPINIMSASFFMFFRQEPSHTGNDHWKIRKCQALVFALAADLTAIPVGNILLEVHFVKLQ